MGITAFLIAAIVIVKKLTSSYGITNISHNDNGDSVELSFDRIITGTTFDKVIQDADAIIPLIIDPLNNFNNDVENYIQKEIAKL